MSFPMQALTTTLRESYIARFIVSTTVLAITVHLSLYLVPATGAGPSLVWPSAAVALAILLFWGLDLWPAIVVAFFIVLLARGYAAPPLVAVTAVANAVEALIGAYLLRHYVGFSPMFSRLRDSLGLVIAAIAASMVSATIITLGVYIINGHAMPSSAIWSGIFVGHTVSLISIGPFVLRWLYRPIFTKTSKEIIEGVAVFGSITTLTILFFWTPYTSVAGVSLIYMVTLLLIWASLRTGPRGISLALALLALVGASGVFFGYGPISSTANLSQTLFSIQVLIGVLSLIFLFFTSITEERKEAVNELEAHVDQLEVALDKISYEDQAKADFIAILAHELRNPLSPVLSGVELLKMEGKGSPDVLRMMSAHLNTAARLLDDLLDISRISHKKFKLLKETVEIHAVINAALEMVQPSLELRRHKLTTELPEEDIWLEGDPVRLGQIFVNLLTNANKYTEPGGTISLRVRREKDELVATVTDSGIGIDEERLGKIFEPFGGSEGNERLPGGLRIGLSLAQRMAQMHHGSVSVESPGLNKGSTFTVRIPLPQNALLPLPHESRPGRSRGHFSPALTQESATKLGSMEILVVDDNEAAAQGIAKLLEHHGHKVRVAYDAPEALVLCETYVPQVAILDIGLPTMDGYRLGELLRGKLGPDLILIALTGYGQSEDRQKSKDSGFDEHMIKPVSVADLQRVLLVLRGR